jgi:hypothetical protein
MSRSEDLSKIWASICEPRRDSHSNTKLVQSIHKSNCVVWDLVIDREAVTIAHSFDARYFMGTT